MYGRIVRVSDSLDMYDKVNEELAKKMDTEPSDWNFSGHLIHVCRKTDDGFEVYEVWESKEAAAAFTDARLKDACMAAGVAWDDDMVEEFSPHMVMAQQVEPRLNA